MKRGKKKYNGQFLIYSDDPEMKQTTAHTNNGKTEQANNNPSTYTSPEWYILFTVAIYSTLELFALKYIFFS